MRKVKLYGSNGGKIQVLNLGLSVRTTIKIINALSVLSRFLHKKIGTVYLIEWGI